MAILVTGAAGFIGSHMVERLLAESDAKIVALDDFNSYYSPDLKRANVAGWSKNPRVTLIEGTFCDLPAMVALFKKHKIERVVHLGAYAGVRASVQNPLIFQESNVGGTLALLEAARQHPVERFVMASSSTVYGNGAKAPFAEDGVLGIPASPYGATKRAAELLAMTYWQLHKVPIVCLRPFSIYGPRLRPDLALCVFAAAILDGKPLPLFGDGSARRDFTHVRDMTAAIQAALEKPDVAGQAINVGNDHPVAIRDVISALEELLGRKANIDRQPPKAGDMDLTHADLSKAKRLLDYAPRVPFQEGLGDFTRWFAEARPI